MERIEYLLEKWTELTAEERAEIRTMCADHGIEVTFKTRCSDCYHDALILLRNHFKKSEAAQQQTGSGYTYTAAEPMRWLHYTLNADTPRDVIVKYIENNPLQHFFKKDENE